MNIGSCKIYINLLFDISISVARDKRRWWSNSTFLQ